MNLNVASLKPPTLAVLPISVFLLTVGFQLPNPLIAHADEPGVGEKSTSQQAPEDEDAFSRFDASKARWLGLPNMTVVLQYEETEDVGGFPIPLGSGEIRLQMDREKEQCVYATVRRTIPFEKSIQGEISGSVTARIVHIDGNKANFRMFPRGSGDRTDSDFESLCSKIGVADFRNFGIGRFPNTLENGSGFDDWLAFYKAQPAKWMLRQPTDSIVEVSGEFKLKRFDEKLTWHFDKDRFFPTKFVMTQDTRSGFGYRRLYSHAVEWGNLDNGFAVPIKLQNIRRRGRLIEDAQKSPVTADLKIEKGRRFITNGIFDANLTWIDASKISPSTSWKREFSDVTSLPELEEYISRGTNP